MKSLCQASLSSNAVGTYLAYVLKSLPSAQNFLVLRLAVFQLTEVVMKRNHFLQGRYLTLPQVYRKLPFIKSLTIRGRY